MERYSTSSLDDSSNASLLPSHEDSVDEEEYSAFEKNPQRRSNPRRLRWLYIVKQFLLYTFALIGLATVIYIIIHTLQSQNQNIVTYDSNHTAQYKQQPCYCGTSVTEASALGCTYDELSTSWMPPHCRDEALTAEFGSVGDNPAGGWMYWADKNHTQPLSMEQVGQYADIQPETFHMSYQWHRQHCFFLWRKEHRMKARGMVYDPRSDSEHHILHCIQILSTPSNGTAAGASLVG